MKKACLLMLVCICFALLGHAQDNNRIDSSKKNAPSVLQSDTLISDEELLKEIRSLLDSLDIRKSYFSIYLGAGNRLFSIRNNNFNAQQQTDNKFSLTPTLSYYHKTGLGLNFTSFITFDKGSANFYQHALSPSYDYFRGKHVVFGVAYTHYFTKDDLNFYATPFKDEFYGYARLRKPWFEPGLIVGYAKGKYREIFEVDTMLMGIPVQIRDTSLVNVRDFALVGSVSHSFQWNRILFGDDNLTIYPQFSVAAGFQQFETDSKGRVVLSKRLNRVGRRYNYSTVENSGFRMQSVACSVNLSYFIGKFVIAPQYYLSYFIPESDHRFVNIFSVMAGVTF